MNVKEWEEHIRLLGLDQRILMLDALRTLETWEPFGLAYSETGIFLIRKMIEISIDEMREGK